MSSESIKTGYYGKIPANGDFIKKDLPRCFIDPWDTWLQEAISTSRQQLGERWLDCYLTSPLYRFIVTPGICGDRGWMGVLMPSVDKVGRYYPLTIAIPKQESVAPFVALQKKDWFSDIEKLALSCLGDDFNLEKFNQGIDRIGPAHGDDNDVTLPQFYTQARHPAWRQALSSLDALPNLMPAMLDTLLREQCFAYSLWWTEGSELVAPSLLICAGLPPYDGLAAMYDGNWQLWGWENKRFSAPFLENFASKTDA